MFQMEPDGLTATDAARPGCVERAPRGRCRRLWQQRRRREKLALDQDVEPAARLGPHEGARLVVAAPGSGASLVRAIPMMVASTMVMAAAAGACRRAATRRGPRAPMVQAASERHVRKHGGQRERLDQASHACLRRKNATYPNHRTEPLVRPSPQRNRARRAVKAREGRGEASPRCEARSIVGPCRSGQSNLTVPQRASDQGCASSPVTPPYPTWLRTKTKYATSTAAITYISHLTSRP